MRRLHFLFLLALIGVLSVSCTDDDFSTDSSCRLTYSVDTVSLDTVMAGVPSPLQRVVVYNNSGENLKTDRIGIGKSSQYFFLNVNGRNGSEHRGVEILDGDSILIYVMVGGKEVAENMVVIEDELNFTYNGNSDNIHIVAVSRNAYVLRNHTITSDTVFTSERPILVYDTLRIGEGATLKIEAGTDVFMYNGGVIVVDGSLICDGDFDKRIRFRYFRGDDMLEGVPYYKAAGNWRGVFVNRTAKEVTLLCTQIVGGEYGLVCDSLYAADGSFVTIGYSEIGYSKYGGLVAEASSILAFSSIFANGGLYNVRLIGGEYSFVQCTIASYNSESGIIRNPTLCVGNRIVGNDGDGQIVPLALSLQNCIVYGSHKEEMKAETGSLNAEANDYFALYINNSLLCGNEFENATVYDNRWNANPKFKIDGGKLSYDFHIDSLNAARAIANYKIYELCPGAGYDIDGKLRVDLENDSTVQYAPDAGAYEF